MVGDLRDLLTRLESRKLKPKCEDPEVLAQGLLSTIATRRSLKGSPCTQPVLRMCCLSEDLQELTAACRLVRILRLQLVRQLLLQVHTSLLEPGE